MQLKNSNKGLVSVVINCLNGEATISRALKSVNNQTYQNLEVIFVDNGSIDNSVNIVKTLIPNATIVELDITISLGAARSIAIERCNGEFIAFLDVDDEWTTDKLEIQLEHMTNVNYGLCYGGVVIKSQFDSKTSLPQYPSGDHKAYQLENFEINMVTAIIRHDVLIEHDLNFSENMQASEEYNLFMKIVLHKDVCTIQKVLGYYYASENSLTYQKINRWWIERKITLIELQRILPDIVVTHKSAFQKAKARGRYYTARALMVKGRNKSARRMLWSIKDVSLVYLVFFTISHFPKIWALIHKDKVKRALTNLIFCKLN